MYRLFSAIVFGAATAACAPTTTTQRIPSPEPQVGVLVMAHGGSSEWDAAVEAAVEPLRDEMPTSLAFGMANPATLASSLEELESRGVNRVAVVRVFLSGASFLHQTEYLLGLRPDAPRWFIGHHGMMDHTPDPIGHGVDIATHLPGLSDSPLVERILADRVKELGKTDRARSVLLIAHGMGDDQENDAVLERMRVAAAGGLSGQGLRRVEVAALREDWPEKRAIAERQIREFVDSESRRNVEVVVMPFRLFGMGPYPAVLDGLDYRATEGLVPHEHVTDWIRQTALEVACGQGWNTPLGSCVVADGAPIVR